MKLNLTLREQRQSSIVIETHIIVDKIDDIVKFIEEVGVFLLSEQQSKSYKIFQKDDNTLVTECDYSADLMIKSKLQAMFGMVNIISEEDDLDTQIITYNNDSYFILDPIDGTKSFIALGTFSINLTYIYKKKPIFSIIHSPFEKYSYIAINNDSFIKENNSINKISNRNIYDLSKMLNITVGFSYKTNTVISTIINQQLPSIGYQLNNLIVKSSAIKIGTLIDNKSDLIIYTTCGLWDIIASYHILTNLGFYVSYINSNQHSNGLHLKLCLMSKSQDLIDKIITLYDQ